MNIIIFEDNTTETLQPFSLNHSPFELRVGAITNIERIINLFKPKSITLIVRDNLRDIIQERYPNYTVNPSEVSEGLCLNSSCILKTNDLETLNQFNNLSNQGQLISFHLNKIIQLNKFMELINNQLDITVKCDIYIMKYLWDIFELTQHMIIYDYELFALNNHYEYHHSLISVNDDKIHIGKQSKICGGVILDASDGPIIIDDNVIIDSGAIIKGPVYIGTNSIISSGSQIKGHTIIGPMCKVGGEVISCNFMGYSNKVHDGFLGHSFIGEWVNIGAGCNNSNLKNNYNNIRMKLENNVYDTKLQFLGSFIGDYTRIAIGTSLNTGTYIGLGSNIFNHSFNKKYIPSFSWGNDKRVEFDKLIETIAMMKKRRNKSVSSIEKKVLKKLFLK